MMGSTRRSFFLESSRPQRRLSFPNTSWVGPFYYQVLDL